MALSEKALTGTENTTNVQSNKAKNVNVGETERLASAVGGRR